MDVTVCIPWRPQPDRLGAYHRVLEHWKQLDYPIIESDSQPGLDWHLAEARNFAVEQCEGVVIVADADTLPDPSAISRAVELAQSNCVVWPYTRYHYIPSAAIALDFEDLRGVRPIYTKPGKRASDKPSVGGCFVTNTWTYWAIGGQDERFERRWGWEDSAFELAARTLSTIHRVDADIYAFAHNVEGGRDWSDTNPNTHRFKLYEFADGEPEIMRELIKR